MSERFGEDRVHVLPSNGKIGDNAKAFGLVALARERVLQLAQLRAPCKRAAPLSLTDTHDHVSGETGWLNGVLCARSTGD